MSLHPMHPFRLEVPVQVVEIESRVKVRTSPIPPKAQRRAIDVLIFDLHFGNTGDRGQYLRGFCSNHIGFNRSGFPFHHYRAAHSYFPLFYDTAVYASAAEQHVRNIGDPSYAASVRHCVKCNTFANGRTAREPHVGVALLAMARSLWRPGGAHDTSSCISGRVIGNYGGRSYLLAARSALFVIPHRLTVELREFRIDGIVVVR